MDQIYIRNSSLRGEFSLLQIKNHYARNTCAKESAKCVQKEVEETRLLFIFVSELYILSKALGF